MALLETLTADFTTGVPATLTPVNGAAGVAGAATAGRYTITVTTGATGYAQLLSAATYDLTGSHAYIEVPDAGDQAASGLECYPLSIEADASNKLFMVISGGFIGCYQTVAGAQTGLAFPAYNPAVHRWFRIREQAGTVYWEASATGSAWSTLTSTATPIPVSAVTLVVNGGSYAALGATKTMSVDNLNVPGATIAATITDQLGITDLAARAVTASRAAADTLGVTDTAGRTLSVARTAAGQLAVTDTASVALTAARTAGDHLGALDQASAVQAAARQPADTAGATDTASAVMSAVRSPAEQLGVTDTVTAVLIPAVPQVGFGAAARRPAAGSSAAARPAAGSEVSAR
jgi:hypothetical protein